MKAAYDFSQAQRGAVHPSAGKKLRITIRLDKEIVEWFNAQVEAAGGGNYQTLLNNALRDYIAARGEPLEEILWRVVRKELRAAH